MNHDFPSIEEVVAIHDALIRETGGSMGLRDPGALASAMMRPQLGYYEDMTEEAAAMLESLAIKPPLRGRQTSVPRSPSPTPSCA